MARFKCNFVCRVTYLPNSPRRGHVTNFLTAVTYGSQSHRKVYLQKHNYVQKLPVELANWPPKAANQWWGNGLYRDANYAKGRDTLGLCTASQRTNKGEMNFGSIAWCWPQTMSSVVLLGFLAFRLYRNATVTPHSRIPCGMFPGCFEHNLYGPVRGHGLTNTALCDFVSSYEDCGI